ncbi:unnamed protein product, partial [Rhizoctonia solani]
MSGSGSNTVSKAGSQAGSQADTWAELVGWDDEFHELDTDAYKDRPEAKKLKEVVAKSFMVPAWLAGSKSPKYTYFAGMERLRQIVDDLSMDTSDPEYTKVEDDKSLSDDVEECLPLIIQIFRHTQMLKSPMLLEAMEADRCHPVDVLASLVWDIQSDQCVIYRTERQLQIPYPSKRKNNLSVRPDGCAYFQIPEGIADAAVPPEMLCALSCFHSNQSSASNYGCILHWVTEFKRRAQAVTSKQQVVEGLVSALYQRRAFGFPNHFVF